MVLRYKVVCSYFPVLLIVIFGSFGCSSNSINQEATSGVSSLMSKNSNEVAATATVVQTTPQTSKIISSKGSTGIQRSSVVGGLIPDFEMNLADGTKVSLASLLSQNKPVFLYFFARW